MIGKIVERNGKVAEVKITACMSPSLLRREIIDGATVERRNLDGQGAEGSSL